MWRSVFRRCGNIVKRPSACGTWRSAQTASAGPAWRGTALLGAVRIVFGLTFLVGIGAIGSASARSAGTPGADGAGSAYQQMRDSQPYAPNGAQTCLTCHNSPPVNDILKTPMGVASDPATPLGQHGCESCHGPSGYHAELKMVDGKLILPPVLFKKPKINVGVDASPVAAQNKACQACHQGDMPINWMGSPHQTAQLACASCHTVHALKDPVLVRTTQPKVCFSCHQDVRAMSFEYSHHPIREGKVVCSDCHNPMGGHGPYQLKQFTVNQTCYQCHADKRGPYLWEHQPVRDNCTNCHNPHGSNQVRLLKQPQNFLCASCHSGVDDHMGGTFGGAGTIPGGNPTGTPYVSSMIANQRNCLNCHSQIHGSNSPAGAYFFR